jgi:hypothetical protein
MLNNRQLPVKASVLVGMLLVGVSLFSDPASAQFRPNSRGNGVAIVFADPGFRGASYAVRGDTPDLRPYRLNDKVSSIEIPAGEAWEVCQSVNYSSSCQILRGSVADLRTMGWDDKISSLRRVDGNFRDGRQSGVFSQPRTVQGLVFYDRTGYRGAAYDQGSLGNHRARSVEVRSGGTWELCDRTGRCTTISQSVTDLSRLGLNGQIRSVRPVNNAQARPRFTPRDRNFGR